MGAQDYWARHALSRRRLLRASGVAALGLGGAALIGCGNSEESGGTTAATAATSTPMAASSATATPASAATMGATNASLVSAVAQNAQSTDPQTQAGNGISNATSNRVIFGLGAQFVYEGEGGVIVPNLLESYPETNADRTEYIYKLRPGVKWQNGDPFTAEDVQFTYYRMGGRTTYDPDFVPIGPAVVSHIDTVDVVDDLTARIKLTRPDINFLRIFHYVVPKKDMMTRGDAAWVKDPVTLGQFKQVSTTPDVETKHIRYDDYFHPYGDPSGLHPSYVQNLTQKVIPDRQARVAALKAGEVDMVVGLEAPDRPAVEDDPNLVVYELYTGIIRILMLNEIVPTLPGTDQANPFRDIRVRQAVNQFVDIDQMIKTLMPGGIRNLGANPRAWGHPTDKSLYWHYNPAEATKLMAAAGYSDGFDAGRVIAPQGKYEASSEVVSVIAQALTDGGIRAQGVELPVTEYNTILRDKSLWSMGMWSSGLELDASALLQRNWIKGSTPGSLAMDDEARFQAIDEIYAEFDDERRRQLTEDLLAKLYREGHWINLWMAPQLTVSSNKWKWDPWFQTDTFPAEYWNMQPVNA